MTERQNVLYCSFDFPPSLQKQ